jgi:hypothetical protein
MKALFKGLTILVLGALIFSYPIAYMGLDPVPGDLAFRWGSIPVVIPVTYSLCASGGLALLFYFLKG